MSGTILVPRVRVLSNGQPLPTPIGVEITTNNYYHPSDYSITWAASSAPGMWWDVEPPWVLDVQLSTDGSTFTTLITGEVDQTTVSVKEGLVSVTGRDYIAAFIESVTQELFANQTASEIATTLAARHNLAAVVTPTTTLAGTFYVQDHARTTHGQFSRPRTEWDLLTYLAQREGFDVWVQGRTLYFQKQVAPNKPDFTIAVDAAAGVTVANVEQLHMARALTLAKDIQVDVRSWNSRRKAGFTKSVRAIGAKVANVAASANQVGVQSQRYVFVRPNLTEQQALTLAQTMLEQLSRHERNIEVEMPGETALTARSLVALTGTGTTFDQNYWIDSMQRRVTAQGFRETLKLKNHSPGSQVVLS